MGESTPEVWRPIPGYERTYRVSSLGRVWSAPRPRTRGGIKDQQIDTRGYPAVILNQDGKQKTWPLHRLVALAFLGEPPKGMEIRHLNGDKLDPRLENLAYGTHAENIQDCLRHGTHTNAAKTHCPRGHAYTADNIYSPPSRPTLRLCRACRRVIPR